MRLPALLVVPLLLAGCVQAPAPDGSDDDAGDDAAAAGLAMPWELRACRYFVADVSVPAERLQPLLPEGFTVEGQPSPLAPVTGAGPYLGIEAFTCDEGTGLDNETVAPIAWASLYTSVVPPENLTVPDHLLFVMWDTLVPDEARRNALAARGLPVHAGDVRIDDGPGPGIVATFDMEDLGTFRMGGTTALPGQPFGGDFIEWMEAEDGSLAAWRTHYEAETLESGRGFVDVPEGSWVADVLGGTNAPMRFITGTWSFTGGNVTMPA